MYPFKLKHQYVNIIVNKNELLLFSTESFQAQMYICFAKL